MPKIFVESTSNHPYGDRMRMKSTRYEIDDTDLDLLVKLKRVRVLSEDEAQEERGSQTYLTRDMNAGRIMTSIMEPQSAAEAPRRGRRPRPASTEAPAPDAESK